MVEVGSYVGKLRIDAVIGRGGMGTVAVATHVQLGQRVAIKIAHDELASDPAFVERFVREARACASLRSEHACRVSDVGQLPSGAPYLVMELLEGSDLAAIVAHRPLAIPVAVDYVLQACTALAEAHALGIVHRDLKPSNLFLTKRLDGSPLVKVLDFGIAKAPAGDELELTRTATVLGSPRYMSPEQLRSARDVDARSDIWALGVILYELVSGRVPFPGLSITELTMMVAVDAPMPLDVDPAFLRVVLRCLEKSADRRYPDVVALAAELRPLAPGTTSGALIESLGRPSRADRQPPPLAPRIDALAPTAASVIESPAVTTLGGASTELPTQRQRRRGGRLVVAGLAAAAIAGVAYVAVPGRETVAVVQRDAAIARVEPRTPADALTVVARSPPDDASVEATPPTLSTAPDSPRSAELRAALRQADHDHVWTNVVARAHELSAIGSLDAESSRRFELAASNLVSNFTPSIIEATSHGRCAAAAQLYDGFRQTVRPEQTLDNLVANCFATAAHAKYVEHDLAGATEQANHALGYRHADQQALGVLGAVECKHHRDLDAKPYLAKTTGEWHDFIVDQCKQP